MIPSLQSVVPLSQVGKKEKFLTNDFNPQCTLPTKVICLRFDSLQCGKPREGIIANESTTSSHSSNKNAVKYYVMYRLLYRVGFYIEISVNDPKSAYTVYGV